MCARYLSDQNRVVLLLESGTYNVATTTAIWSGFVTSHDIVETQNVIQTRYLGQANRNVGRFDDGPLNVEGTLTFQPQDFRLLGYALGSIAVTSGTAQADNYQHALSEVNSDARHTAYTSGTFNPWASFTIEESRTGNVANRNSMRTIKGCVVNDYKLTVTQGDPVEVEVGFIAQSGSWFSGATTSVTAGSNRPFLWSDVSFELPGGTAQQTVKELAFTLSNNFTAPHYLNGSRFAEIQYPGNREYAVSVTQDLFSTTVGSLYQTYFKGGSIFNAVLDINNTQNTGSHHLILTMSGCRIIEMTSPAETEGVNEISYTIVPGSVSALYHSRLVALGPF